MKNAVLTFCLALVCIGMALGDAHAQEGQPIAVVFTFDVPPQQQGAFLELASQAKTVVMGHAPQAQQTIYGAFFTGPDPNRIVVLTEFPSAEVWGAAVPSVTGDSEYQRIGREILALDGVELVSRSLVTKLAP